MTNRQVPILDGDAVAAMAAAPRRSRLERDTLALAHLDLLSEVAGWLRVQPTAVAELGDFHNAGAIGLLAAAEEWDPGRGPFEPYARSCVANQMRHLRRDSRWRKTCTPQPDRRLLSLDAPCDPDIAGTLADTLADAGDGPEDELLGQEDEQERKAHKLRVLTVLSRLPDGDRALLHTRYINGFRVDVTAALLGLTVDQVKWRMRGARQRFAEAWLAAAPASDPAVATAAPHDSGAAA
jgi:RNA polymerase sigma factor (sigma-70 family)